MTVEKLSNYEPLFGSWTVDGELSQNSSSKLFRVSRETNLGKEYFAVKTIRFPKDETEYQRIVATGSFENGEEYLSYLEETFKTNMEKMMSLRSNKNIVSFEDYMIIKGVHCFYGVILTEPLYSLSQYLTLEKRTPKELSKLGSDIANALVGFRSLSVVHKEIKPENIYVSHKGVYKLGDFGLDRKALDFDTLKESEYCPPEIYESNNNTYCADVYSLGITLYKLCCQKEAMPSAKRISDKPLSMPPSLDSTFSKIILKATEYYPQKRYKAPEYLLNDLKLYLSGMTISPKAPTPTIFEAKAASAKARSEFEEAFSDEEELDEKESNKKKLYILIGALIGAILIFSIAASFIFGNRNEPQTVETTTVRPIITKATEKESETSLPDETTSETALETTTEEETTTKEETTTEETTIEETTAEKTTAEETTTTEERTETTTAFSVLSSEVILYKESNKAEGETDSEGREYKSLSSPKAKAELQGDSISKVTVSAKSFGSYPIQNGNAYICQVTEGTVILKEPLDFTCSFDEDEPDDDLTVIFNLYGDIYYDDATDFYIIFEEGAVASDDYISLPVQIKL